MSVSYTRNGEDPWGAPTEIFLEIRGLDDSANILAVACSIEVEKGLWRKLRLPLYCCRNIEKVACSFITPYFLWNLYTGFSKNKLRAKGS